MTKFYYKVLGLPEDCTHEEIKKKYRTLALEWHPDKNAENRTRASEMFNIISEAYQVLGNREKRAKYDSTPSSSSYKPSKLYNPMDLFNYIFGVNKSSRKSRSSSTSSSSSISNSSNQSGINTLVNYNPDLNEQMNMLSMIPSIFNHSNMMQGFDDNFFKEHSSSHCVFHQSTSIIRNGKKETKSVNGYYKDGKKHVEKKHTYFDKDGQEKTDIKKYIVPSKSKSKSKYLHK